MDKEGLFSRRNIKLFIWSISAGVIVAFFFASNILDFATGFSPGGEILLFSPAFCGFILGILTTTDEVYHSVVASIFMTITAIVLITLSLFSPLIFNVSGGVVPDYYVFVVQHITISVVLIFPVSLGSAVLGKVVGEMTLMSSLYKTERSLLRQETLEWYQMLEAAAPKKRKLAPIGGEPGEDTQGEVKEIADEPQPTDEAPTDEEMSIEDN